VLAQAPHTHEHSSSGPEQWASYFDDPARGRWRKPHEAIQALTIAPDATVADIGVGTSCFWVRWPKGRVYAVDTEPDMVKYLTHRAKREKPANGVAMFGEPGDPQLPAKGVGGQSPRRPC
jgi:hypothetical protein